jgi:signal transduction histidine kinase
MRVSHRLLLTMTPAFVGLLTVVALAYWGQYERQAPHFAVGAAVIALSASVVLALRNARYLAHRIERLAGTEPGLVIDELDSIEQSVERLQGEVTAAHEEIARRERAAEAKQKELATLLSSTAGTATTALNEVQLPLHILLENRFGDLNENQEEMLGSAQAAADDASALLRRLQLTADLDRGAIEFRRDPVRVDDIVRALLPTLQSLAERRNVRVVADLSPALPRVPADRTYLLEALSIILRGAVERTTDRGEVRVSVESVPGQVKVTATHGAGALAALDAALVMRLTRAMGVRVLEAGLVTVIELPAAPVGDR